MATLSSKTGLPSFASSAGAGELNAISNPSAAQDINSWSAGTGHSVARDIGNSPLSPIISTSIAATCTTPQTEASLFGVSFPIATMPTGLRNKKLKLEFHMTSPAAASVWRVSVYAGATRLPLSTDTGGFTTITGGVTGKFTTYFDTDSSTSYTLRVTQVSGTGSTLYMTNVIVGPGIQPQGAVVGEWQSFVSDPISNYVLGTGGNSKFYWRRVGSAMEVQGAIAFGSGGSISGTLYFNLPAGHSLNANALGGTTAGGNYGYVGTGIIRDSDTAKHYPMYMYRNVASLTQFAFSVPLDSASAAVQITATSPFTWTVSDEFHIATAQIPIAEWAGSGTINLAQNDVEYASNFSSSTTASDTTSFAYGPAGSQIRNITLELDRSVKFQTPILASDSLMVEISPTGAIWYPLSGSGILFPGVAHVSPLVYQTGTSYGIGRISPVDATTIQVRFGRYLGNVSSAYGSAGDSYGATLGGYYWRVRKISGGAAVGFGLADATSSGLVGTGTQTFAGEKTLSGGVKLATSGGTATLLNYYEEWTGTSTASTGAITTAAILRATRVGRLVTLHIPEVLGTATAVNKFTFGETLPLRFRPATESIYGGPVRDNGALLDQIGGVFVRISGVVEIFRTISTTANFTNATNCGKQGDMSVSYFTNN